MKFTEAYKEKNKQLSLGLSVGVYGDDIHFYFKGLLKTPGYIHAILPNILWYERKLCYVYTFNTSDGEGCSIRIKRDDEETIKTISYLYDIDIEPYIRRSRAIGDAVDIVKTNIKKRWPR